MAASTLTHHSVGTRITTRQTLLLVLAVGQLISPVFSALYGGAFTTENRPGEPPIVPAGYAFTIWGAIQAFSLAYALWAVTGRRPDAALRERLAAPLLVVFAGFSAWIVAAEVEPTWSTLVVFLVILAGLLRALEVALTSRVAIARWSRLGRVLLWGTLGLYTGWSSIAIWLNLTTALAGSGAPLSGPVGVAGQLAVLAGATATAVALTLWTRGLLPYVLAVAWAFVGAVLGARDAGEPGLAVACGIGLVIVLGAYRLVRRRAVPDRTGRGRTA